MVSHDHPWTFQKEWSKEDITNSYKEWISIIQGFCHRHIIDFLKNPTVT